MSINGRKIASEIFAATKELTMQMGGVPVVRAVSVAPTNITELYLRAKAARAADAGMQISVVSLTNNAHTEDVIAAVRAPGADAVIVQLPLPPTVDTEKILASIPVDKDADVLSVEAYARFIITHHDALIPPVAAAVREVLERSNIQIAGAQAVVVGEGRLVGAPVAAWLRAQGAEVMVLNEESFDNGVAALRAANIIVSGAGVPHLITPSMITGDVVLIDAGTSEEGGSIKGDIDPACADIASVFTPVPGGIGPITVACLFRNVAQLRNRENGVH